MKIRDLIVTLLDAPSLDGDAVVKIGDKTFELDSVDLPPYYNRGGDATLTIDADNAVIAEATGAQIEE